MRVMRAVLVVAAVAALAGCKKEEPKTADTPPAPGTPEWKIRNATSAGPEYVASAATVVEMVPNDTVMPTIRAGTNGWTCFTDDPRTPVNDPGCADDEMMKWYGAWLAHQPPRLTGMGLMYALQGSQLPSLTDPFKTAPDSGRAWVDVPPSIFIVLPDPRAFRGLPTAPVPGKPWVVFAGTPYAVLVVPAAAPAAR
jgi:hypothetical protein